MALLYAALLAFAHSPLLRTGLFAGDYRSLLREDAAAPWMLIGQVLGLPSPGASAWPWRVLSLVLVGLSALALWVVLARALAPRIGAHAARSSALVAALLLPLHPALPDLLLGLAALPELLALALSLGALALFLNGRQEGRDAWTSVALVLLIAAGSASPVAILVVPAFAACEYLSVRRQRPRHLRARTTLTTALIFAAGAALPLLLWGDMSTGAVTSGGADAGPGGARARLLDLLSQLGRAAIPSAGAPSTPMILFSGGLLLLALQPAFQAARNAPRLWSSILLGWCASLVPAVLWAGSGNGARMLLVVLVWCVGLGLTVTASARPRRAVLAGVIVVGWALLTHAGGRPALALSHDFASWYREVAALEPRGAGRVLLLDPPGSPPGSADVSLGWAFHPSLGGRADPSAQAFDPRRIQGLSRAAFLQLVGEEGFSGLRQEGLSVVVRAPEGHLRRVDLPVPAAGRLVACSWSNSLTHSPPAPLDPLAAGFARITAELSTRPDDLARLGWRTRAGEEGAVSGRLSERGGRRVAEFDLGGSLEWRLAGSVRMLVVEDGKRSIEGGEVQARLPQLVGAGEPQVEGPDWFFERPQPEQDVPAARTVLVLLAHADWELRELLLEVAADGRLCARGAQEFVRLKTRDGAPLGWSLDYRIGERTLQRSRGSVDRTP